MFNSLRPAIAGICLFTAITSAQAQLSLTFEEDVAKGQLKVTFSGQIRMAPPTELKPVSSGALFNEHTMMTAENTGYLDESPWTSMLSEPLWTNGPSGALVSHSGTGGLLIGPSPDVYFYTTPTESNHEIVWDGTLIYNGTLAEIGIIANSSGAWTLHNGLDDIHIYWTSTLIPVPEPATYSLALGLGVIGIALLRHRASRR